MILTPTEMAWVVSIAAVVVIIGTWIFKGVKDAPEDTPQTHTELMERLERIEAALKEVRSDLNTEARLALLLHQIGGKDK